MRRSKLFSAFVLLTMMLTILTVPTVAQGPSTAPTTEALSEPLSPDRPQKVPPAASARLAALKSRGAPPAPRQVSLDQGSWQYGPPSDFQYQRFDGAFVPGPAGESWANRVYFLGGRIAAPSELPDIWVFDPVTGLYTDTLADMIEDVSNYNCDLILDDGTARGPAIYVVGGFDKDGGSGGGGLGMVQRYYPQLNLIEALPPADDWPGQVAGYTVSGMGTAVVDDVIYVFGGWESSVAPYFYNGTWAFDPTQPSGSRWTDLGVTLNTGRCYIPTAAQDGKVYAMGGISQYVGGDLVPTDAVEVLDTNNVAAGWTALAPMPVPIAEGRGFGFDADTLGLDQLRGRLYVVGGGDWPDPSAEAMEYFIEADTWDQAFPDLNVGRVNHAGTYIPLYTPDPNDGLPGMWVFGGRDDDSCDPPYGPTEFYAAPLVEQCSILLVDDDWDQYSGEPFNGTGTYYYTSTLEALGLGYDRWDVWTQGDPALADLQGYDAVIWFTGYAWAETITATNEADLAAYLDGGGNLFLSSEDYLYDQGITAFGAFYLGLDDAVMDTEEVDPIGNAGDPIGDGLGPYTLTTPSSWPVDDPVLYTDEVLETPGVGAPFRYQASGENNSTDLNGGIWRTVFWAWPLEGLDDLGERTEVMNRVLNWFCFSERPAEVILLPPSQAGSGVRGTDVVYTLTLINNLGFADTFTIDYDAAWPTTGPISIGPLADGASQNFVVTVTIPVDSNCYDMDTAIVTATSVFSPSGYWDTALIHTTSDSPGEGDLAGIVYDANTTLGIPNAHVYLELGSTYTETWADINGAYGFSGLPACTYAGGADATRYYSASFTATLEVAVTTTLDVYLAASMPALSDDAVSVTVPAGSVYTYPMTLTNNGTGDLLFQISEVPTDTVWLVVDPVDGTVAPSASTGISLTFDTAGLTPDACYTGTLWFEFNDPYTMETFLPVELCVEVPCVPPESIDFTWSPTTPTVGVATTFTATVVGTPTQPLTFSWDFGDGTIVVTTDTVVTHPYTATGTYTVTLMVASPCYDGLVAHTLTVTQVIPPEYKVYLPIVMKNH